MMGLISSRRSAGAEEPEVSTGNPYRYPPRSGEFILWSRIFVIFTDTKQWQESFQCGQSQWTRHMHSLVSENHHEFTSQITATTTVSATNSLRPNWYAEREVKPSVLWRCWLGGRKGIRPVKTEWWDVGGHIYFRGPRGYTINLWLCCGGWRRDADPRWK